MKKILSFLLMFSLMFSSFSFAEEKQSDFKKDLNIIFENTKEKHSINYNDLGIYVLDLNTGEEWGYQENKTKYDNKMKVEDAYFKAASVIKLHVAYSVVRILKNENKTLNDYFIDPVSKKKYKVADKINDALKNSSNIAFNNLMRTFGSKKINKEFEEMNLKYTKSYSELGTDDPYWSIKRNLSVYKTTKGGRINPKETGTLLKFLYEDYKNNDIYAKFLIKSLSENIHDTRIPKGINYKSQVAHKTGTFAGNDKVYSDAGIVFLKDKPFVIVLLSENQNSQTKIENFEREFSKEVYNYFSKK